MITPPPRLPDAAGAADQLADRPLAFFNALLTEHFVLESARGITVSESSSRAALFLTTASGGLVALGFLARTPYALPYLAVLLPVLIVLGLVTFERLIQTALEDVAALASIQRIRGFYATLLPGAERYFPRPSEVGAPNEMLDVGRSRSWRGVFFTLASSVAFVTSLLCGTGAAMLAVVLRLGQSWQYGTGGVVFLLVVALHLLHQERRYRSARGLLSAAGPASDL